LTLGCAAVPVQAQDKVNYHALPSEFKEIYFRTVCRDVSVYVNFYEWQGESLDQVHTIALLPTGYVYEHEMDSTNFPDKEWIDRFTESVKAKLIKGYTSKYIDSSVFDTTSNWFKSVDSYSKHLQQVLIYSSLKAENKIFNRKLLDSLNKLWYHPELFIISPSAIDDYIDTSEFYRDNSIKKKYARWGGKAHYDSIYDNITRIVQSEFTGIGFYKVMPPATAKNKCDSIYNTLDDHGHDLWDTWFYPNTSRDGLFYPYKKTNYSTKNERTKKQLSDAVFQCLGTDAYVVIDISYGSSTTSYIEKRKFEISNQIFLQISMFGPEFNVLWSADFPISMQIRRTYSMPNKKEHKYIYPYEIIDYNMARENVRRTLAVLKANKISE